LPKLEKLLGRAERRPEQGGVQGIGSGQALFQDLQGWREVLATGRPVGC
jgi:hypothetical protein